MNLKKQPADRPSCTYSFFLFSKLFDVVIPNEHEYDLLYADVCTHYGKYCDSEYNNPNKPEYECMLQYLNSIKAQ